MLRVQSRQDAFARTRTAGPNDADADGTQQTLIDVMCATWFRRNARDPVPYSCALLLCDV